MAFIQGELINANYKWLVIAFVFFYEIPIPCTVVGVIIDIYEFFVYFCSSFACTYNLFSAICNILGKENSHSILSIRTLIVKTVVF